MPSCIPELHQPGVSADVRKTLVERTVASGFSSRRSPGARGQAASPYSRNSLYIGEAPCRHGTKKGSDRKFHVKHEGQDLALDLIRVHDDRLQDLGGGKYFACVDMKGTDGKTYDIDFFLTGQPGKMKVTETSVHKIDGKPLYNWKEESGKWNKVPAS